MKLTKLLITTLAALFLLVGCGGEEAQTVIEDSGSIEELREKKKQNIYTLTTIKGEKISFEIVNNIITSKQLNGKVVLLNFFATWCPPCKEEIPMFNRIAEKYPDNFRIVSVLFQDKIAMDKLKAFLNEYKVNFDVTVGEANNKVAQAYRIQKVPESYLFSNEGVMIKKYIGVVDEIELEQIIKEDLKR